MKHERRLPKHSIVLAGHATSISLEPEFWQALKECAAGEKLALAALVARIDKERMKNTNNPQSLTSALRVYVLRQAQHKR